MSDKDKKITDIVQNEKSLIKTRNLKIVIVLICFLFLPVFINIYCLCMAYSSALICNRKASDQFYPNSSFKVFQIQECLKNILGKQKGVLVLGLLINEFHPYEIEYAEIRIEEYSSYLSLHYIRGPSVITLLLP
jgi:hypothetical protein